MNSCIGDWMGSIYDIGGRRWDHHLFIDHDGRYERTVRGVTDFERKECGCWQYDLKEKMLRLESGSPEESNPSLDSWAVLSVESCEDSNVILVLREIVLASRNVPILFYRVHANGKGYGTGWEEHLPNRKGEISDGHAL